MRVLILEEDAALGVFLQKFLELDGHEVSLASDGVSGLEHAVRFAPDLLVTELNLPMMGGVEVLRSLRDSGFEGAILVLTAQASVENRVHCLDHGADDFVAKPFSFHELAARCRALLRRRRSSAEEILRYGKVELNRITRKAQIGSFDLDLTAKEFALFTALLLRRGACCSRGDLLQEVWQLSPDACTNVVDVYMNYLRRKLAAAAASLGGASCVIETVRGAGYRLTECHTVPVCLLPAQERLSAIGA